MISRASLPFIYVHIPRTGGTSIEAALTSQLLGKPLEELTREEAMEWRLPAAGLIHQHDKLTAYPEGCRPAFAFVRNPWDWAVSEVAWFRNHGHPFFAECSWREGLLKLAEGSMQQIWGHDFEPQVSFLMDETGHPGVTWAGRSERLETDFAETCRRLGLPALSLGREQPANSGRPDYRTFYDEETRRAIGERFAVDAAVLGYEFNGISINAAPGLLELSWLRERWLGWLEKEGLSVLGWRRELDAGSLSPSAPERYEGLKHWGWYLDDATRWMKFFRTEARVRAMEIGAFDGVSANLMLDVLFVHPQSEMHTVDPYQNDETTPQVNQQTREHFMRNAQHGGHGRRLSLHEGLSSEVLAWMTAEDGFWESFDFIYVDGSHLAKDVFIDAAMSWNLLKPGGVMGFDDYEWGNPAQPRQRPQLAVDAFESVFGDRISLLFGGKRRFYRKLRA